MRTLKKVTFILFLVLGTYGLKAQQFSIGAGLSYMTDINNLGIDVRALYEVEFPWRGSIDFNYIFPDDVFGININYWSLNLNGHYLLEISDTFEAYPLAGFNIFNVSVDAGNINIGASSTDVGLNLGGGASGAEAADHPDHGLWSFKSGLGATPHPCRSGRLVLRPLRAHIWHSLRRARRRLRRWT